MFRFLLYLPFLLLAAETGPDTVLTEDHFYVTTGTLTIPVPLAEAENVLTDFARYGEWALKGMGGDEPSETWHIAWLQGCLYEPETHTMKVIFGLHLLGALRSRNNSIRFLVEEERQPSGRLERICFSLADKNLFMKQAEYGVELAGDETVTHANYFGFVRLAPIVDIFFNLKIYRKNIEWYMGRIIRNFKDRLTGETGPPSGPT